MERENNKVFLKGQKKFVFYINPENIEYVESLDAKEKHIMINNLIFWYKNKEGNFFEFDNFIKILKKTLFFIILVFVIIPLFFYLLGLSFKATKSNYLYMQENFEKLF